MKKLLLFSTAAILSLSGEASSSGSTPTPYALLESAENHAINMSEDLREAMEAYPEGSPYRKHLIAWNEMIVKLGKAIADNKKSYK